MRKLAVPEIMAQSHVMRWHTQRTMVVQTVADHAANVALLVHRMAAAAGLGYEIQVEAMRWALTHDAHEPTCADLPGPIKAALRYAGVDLDLKAQRKFWGLNGTTFGLSHATRCLVAAADVMERYFWALRFLPDLVPVLQAEAITAIQQHLADYPAAASEAQDMLVEACDAP